MFFFRRVGLNPIPRKISRVGGIDLVKLFAPCFSPDLSAVRTSLAQSCIEMYAVRYGKVDPPFTLAASRHPPSMYPAQQVRHK